MNIWLIIGIVCIAGGVGGIVNAILSDNGFVIPKKDKIAGVYRPGYIGNIFTGAVAAGISWGLYGPFSSVAIVGTSPGTSVQELSLTLAGLVGAVLVGIGGAKWLTNEQDKIVLKLAASNAAAKQSNSDVAKEIMDSSSSWQALEAVEKMV